MFAGQPGVSVPAAKQARPANRILAALSRVQFSRMGLELVNLEFGQVISQPGDRIQHAYFPVGCLISLLAVVEEGADLEVGLLGREGMLGTQLALGSSRSPVRVLVQGTGGALRLPARRFVQQLASIPKLRQAVDRCVLVAMGTAMQIAACNRAHVLEERMVRWLLMVGDRVVGNEFFLTQEFLARMLGVRRAGVTEAASSLHERKLIDYRRGQVRLLDVAGLAAVACSCYGAIRKLEESR